MIVVDSSVWIDFLNGRKAPHVARLQAILGNEEIIVGDLMLCEVLQGLTSERAARQVEGLLRRFEIASIFAGFHVPALGAFAIITGRHEMLRVLPNPVTLPHAACSYHLRAGRILAYA